MVALSLSCGLVGVPLPTVNAVPPSASPVLVTVPQVLGTAMEAVTLTAEASDTWSYNGTAATVTQRDYRLLVGGALVAGPGPVPALSLPTLSGGQSYSYQIRVTISEGGGSSSNWITLAAGIVLDGFDLSQTVDNEIEINNATGQVMVTITAASAYATYDAGNGAGIFTFDANDLTAGPINLSPPRIIGDSMPVEGDILTVMPGLWVYDGDNAAPSITYQWLRDGMIIPGATGNSYTLVAADSGADVRVSETSTDANGERTADGAGTTMTNGTAAISGVTGGAGVITIDYTGTLSITGGAEIITLEAT